MAEQLGQSIGPYKLIERIGEGGYGVVYRAEQEKPIHRFVALKIIKLGMDTKQVIARFEAERQVLALMDHPNIAKVFEAGSTEVGRPFFVMELVEGVKITDYCNKFNLTTRERLALFVLVCRAVQHAHQKGIIHRDLKPSNILVAVQDQKPVPKVIDFGIAKATGQRLTDQTLFTAMGEFIGTPAYMSPEQAGLGEMDLDTRSDIYALGVLLYELLTGHTPFERADLVKAGLDEMRRVIRDHEPPKPSTKLGTLTAADLTAVARHHRTEAPRLLHGVRGDLDWIAMKCLEKDRARRYETASGLALDVERHLNHEPVTAAAPGNLYRLRKFVRRHRVGLAMTSALALLLIAGVVASTWQAVRATKAEHAQALLRRQAEAAEKASQTEASKSRQVAKFLTDMLEGVGPSVALGRDTKMLHDILDKTARRVGKDLKDQPEVEAELLNTVGNTYEELGDNRKADDMIRQALALRKAVFGPEHPRVADSLSDLAAVLQDEDQLSEAEAMFRQALDMRRKLLGNEHRDVATSLSNLGVVLFKEGKLPEAEQAHRQALALRTKLFGDEHADVATSLHNLGNVLLMEGRNSEAETIFRQVVAMRKKLLGDEHPLLATTLGNLGTALWYENKFSEAETVYRETLAMQRKLMGDEHPDVATSLHNLACVLQSQGKFPEAELVCKQALEMRSKLLGADHSLFASTLSALASIYQGQGRFSQAETAQRHALTIQRKRLGPEHPDIAVSLNNLGDILRDEGRYAEAETETRSSLAMMRKLFGDTNQFVAYPLATLANVLRDQGKLAEAETAERETLAMRTNSLGAEHPEVAQSLNDLAVILAAQGRLVDAERLLREALAMRRKLLGDKHPDALDSLNGLAGVLQQRGNLTEAESLALECRDLYDKLLPDDWRAFETRSLLGGILLAQKKYADAEPLLVGGYDGLKQREERIPAHDRRCLKETTQHVIDLYEATARPEKAADWKKRPHD
jgi:serine/threonine protein kinase/Tfp pilus assembly protein PilF